MSIYFSYAQLRRNVFRHVLCPVASKITALAAHINNGSVLRNRWSVRVPVSSSAVSATTDGPNSVLLGLLQQALAIGRDCPPC